MSILLRRAALIASIQLSLASLLSLYTMTYFNIHFEYIFMLYKYFVKFKYNNAYHTRYCKARSINEAFIKLLQNHKINSITSIAIEGDPLPTRQYTATELIQKKEAAKKKRMKGAAKYYQLADKTVFDK